MNSSTDEYVALRERLNEAKGQMIRMQRLANDAADLCQLREQAYAGACHRVRDLEKELDHMMGRKKKWF